MFNDTVWGEKGNAEKCENNSREVANYACRFPRGHWSFLGPGSEKKSYGTFSDKSDGVWYKTAEDMMLELGQTIHPMFRASSGFERGELRSKVGGMKTIHFNGSEQYVELILCTITSANQLIIYGAVADICREVSNDTMTSRKTWSTWSFGGDGNSYWTSYCWPSYWWTATEKLARKQTTSRPDKLWPEMWKHMSQSSKRKEEDRIVAKSKSTAMNMTSTVSTSSSSVNHQIASKSPGILKASAGKPAATDKSQKSWEFSDSESWSNHEKEVTVKPVASRNSGNSENSKAGSVVLWDGEWCGPLWGHTAQKCQIHGSGRPATSNVKR